MITLRKHTISVLMDDFRCMSRCLWQMTVHNY